MVLGATTAALQKVSGALPVSVTVTMLAALVVPGAVNGNWMLETERFTNGAVPVPFKVAVCVPPPLLASSVTVSVMVCRPVAVAA